MWLSGRGRGLIVRLLDQVAQCRAPFVVGNSAGERTHLSGAMELREDVLRCATRYVLTDDLTGLCTDLAHSRGTRVYGCMDLLRIPATRLWVEWSYGPWLDRLRDYGLDGATNVLEAAGRFGILMYASADGQRGTMRAFWNRGPLDTDVSASAVESHFRFDGGLEHDQPGCRDCLRVTDVLRDADGRFARSFHFAFERSWQDYYSRTLGNGDRYAAVRLASAGALAMAVPFLLAFLLLLLNRDGLPQESPRLERLNCARARSGKAPLLEHVEVRAPIFVSSAASGGRSTERGTRVPPRLHHVRGHLVRRAEQIFWRVPHLRGSARRGVLQSRTVTWTVSGAQPRYRATPLEMTNTRPE